MELVIPQALDNKNSTYIHTYAAYTSLAPTGSKSSPTQSVDQMYLTPIWQPKHSTSKTFINFATEGLLLVNNTNTQDFYQKKNFFFNVYEYKTMPTKYCRFTEPTYHNYNIVNIFTKNLRTSFLSPISYDDFKKELVGANLFPVKISE